MRRLSLAVAVVVLGALVVAGSVQACSCVPMAPGEALRRADAAIVGELLEVVPRGRSRSDYRYRVQRVYKPGRGIQRGQMISVRSASQSAACGLPRRTGLHYGLLLNTPPVVHRLDAQRGAGPWVGGLCGVISPRKMRAVAGGGPARAQDLGSLGFASCTS